MIACGVADHTALRLVVRVDVLLHSSDRVERNRNNSNEEMSNADQDQAETEPLSTSLVYIFVLVVALNQLEATLWLTCAVLINVAIIAGSWYVWKQRRKCGPAAATHAGS